VRGAKIATPAKRRIAEPVPLTSARRSAERPPESTTIFATVALIDQSTIAATTSA